MLPDFIQEFAGLGNQFLALNHFVLQFLAVLEITRVLLLPLLIIVNGLNGQIGDETVDIGLNLVQLAPQVQNVK